MLIKRISAKIQTKEEEEVHFSPVNQARGLNHDHRLVSPSSNFIEGVDVLGDFGEDLGVISVNGVRSDAGGVL